MAKIWGVAPMRSRPAAEGAPEFARAKANQEWGEIPGAETTAQLHARVRAGLMRIAVNHADQRVAAFVHGGVISAPVDTNALFADPPAALRAYL